MSDLSTLIHDLEIIAEAAKEGTQVALRCRSAAGSLKELFIALSAERQAREQAEALLREADGEISALHTAMGAPGDYGYDSREGKALFRIYNFLSKIRAVLKEQEQPNG